MELVEPCSMGNVSKHHWRSLHKTARRDRTRESILDRGMSHSRTGAALLLPFVGLRRTNNVWSGKSSAGDKKEGNIMKYESTTARDESSHKMNFNPPA